MISGVSTQLEAILAAGNQAPSGENCQPWHFNVRGSTIEVRLLPQRDQSYYGWGQRASLMACGAAIENMVIAASHTGMHADITYFPEADATHVATIVFVSDPKVAPDPLEEHIFLRSTNRKPYLKIELSENEKDELSKSMLSQTDVALHFTESRDDIDRLAMVGAANEEIMLANESLHSFFFSHLNWTKAEDDAKKIGFYIKTLELPQPAVMAFYVLRYWSVMSQLAQINFEKLIGKQNASVYGSSGAIGALSIQSDEPLEFVKAGRALERLWLTATKMGLYMQPLTGILFFKLKIDGGEGTVFSPEHQTRINHEYAEAQKTLGCVGKRIAFMFRIGSGAPPSARSSRFDLKDVVSVL